MKATKKIISFLLMIALTFSMATSSVSEAKKKAPKLNRKKVTLKVGKTAKLKVKNTKKKVKWSIKSGKKKIKLIKKKKTSVVISAKKQGKATVVAKVGKKTLKCKVTVKKKEETKKVDTKPVETAVKLNAVKVLNPETIQVVLSSAQKLTATNFTVMSKTYRHGSYNKKWSVASVTSTDQKNYIIKVDTMNSEIQENDYVQVTVSGLQKTGTASMETVYTEAPESYVEERIYSCMAGEKISENIVFLGYGSGEIVSKKLPQGMECTINYADDIILLEGAIATTGIHTGEIVYKDELNNTYTEKFTLLVGDEQTIYAACLKSYETYNRKAEEEASTNFYVAGGSGEFTITAEDEDMDIYVKYSSYLKKGFIDVVIPKAGVTNLTFNVVDDNNSKLKTTFVWTIDAKETQRVLVNVKDAAGNKIENNWSVSGHFENQTDSSLYSTMSHISLDEDGNYYVYLMVGETYDIEVDYYKTKKIYDFKTTESIETLDIVLPIYPITLQREDIDISDVVWYDANDEYVGRGNQFYCDPGNYTITGERIGETVYTFEVSFTYDGKSSVTVTPSVTSQRAFAKGTLTAATGTAIVLAEGYEYYKFVPEESGDYYFYCETEDAYPDYGEDTMGVLYDEDMKEIAYNDDCYDDEGEVEYSDFRFTQTCEAGKTYYVGVKAYTAGKYNCVGLNAILYVVKQ